MPDRGMPASPPPRSRRRRQFPPAWTRSLRFRLTAWCVGVLALLLGAAGLLLFLSVRYTLLAETDAFLTQEARRLAGVASGYSDDTADAGDLAEAVRTSDAGSRRIAGPAQALLVFDKTYLRYVDGTSRQTLAASPDLAGRSDLTPFLDALIPSRFPGDGNDTLAYTGPDEERTVRVLTLPVHIGPARAYVQAAVPWDHNEDVTELLGVLLLVGVPVVLVPVALGAWTLVGRTLQPIRRIVAEAERLDVTDLPEALLPEATETDSEIGRLVDTLNQMTTRLRAAFGTERRFSEMQQQFAANASHELRTPLTVLRGEIELAMARPRSPESHQETLARLLQQTVRMERIVDSLGLLARREAGPADRRAAREMVDLTAVAAAVVEETQLRARQSRIALHGPEEQKPVLVHGNTEQLLLLLRNLVDNAVSYTEPGGRVRVDVATQPTAADSGAVRNAVVTIRDTGIGISAEDLLHVFDRFWRADRSRRRPGTGLGLAIAAQIAESHGGALTVTSEVGVGSVFQLLLPPGVSVAETLEHSNPPLTSV